ncbi:MAG: penicillin-binding transpeptidase domain-containing protein, partial [Flavobacteriales bacterium]
EIKRKGKVVRSKGAIVIDDAICSENTVRAAREMLEGVVERGTARNLRNNHYKIAGKTGTAQIANKKYGYKYNSKVSYQASFVGYFPADRPKYSCIVVINAPSKDVYYGNQVAGPVFKEIADKVYASSIDIQEEIQPLPSVEKEPLPVSGKNYEERLLAVLKTFDVPVRKANAHLVSASFKNNRFELAPRQINRGQVPDVCGMPLRDAINLLENEGLIVQMHGMGRVVHQSLPAVHEISRGETIILELN